MAAFEEMSHAELVELARHQDAQITSMKARVGELAESNEELAAKVAKLEHLLSRNSGNSSAPPSKDDEPGKSAPAPKRKRGAAKRSKGKQPGAPGANLSWVERPDARRDEFPSGCCECGHDLDEALDLGIVDRYQQHEIPPVSVTVTQYDQHEVRCGCGRVHTASRPDGARTGPVGYGPNLQAFAVYLMVMHFVPPARCVELLTSLTGAAPSVGFVHGMLKRTAEVGHPDAAWPTQVADALRGLIHQANQARDASREAIDAAVRDELITWFRRGVKVGLAETPSTGTRPGQRKARLLLEVLHGREADVLRFAHDLRVPATSNQAESDLRPSKTQQKISGRLTSEQRTRDRYRIRGYLSTAGKHGHNTIDALRCALTGHPWQPPDAAPA